MKKILLEGMGWYGVGAILFAYFCNSFGILSSTHPAYILLNLTGSIGVALDAYFQKNFQPVALNIIWAFVALIGLIRIIAN